MYPQPNNNNTLFIARQLFNSCMIQHIWLCLFTVILQGSCASASSGPTVAITVFGDEKWSPDDLIQLTDGSEVWDDMGFLYVMDPNERLGTDVCPNDWFFKHKTECKIRVGITRVPRLLEEYGVVGLSDRANGTIEVDSRFSGLYLRHICAHEFGHILLNTGRHLPAEVTGIMQPSGSEIYPSEADWALACVSTGICID